MTGPMKHWCSGRVDIALGLFSGIPHRLREQLLLKEHDMMVIAKNHSLADSKIGLDALSNLPLFVTSTASSEQVNSPDAV